MARARLPARIFGPEQVDVAYEPWRVTGFAHLRVGPSGEAPVVLVRGKEVTVRPGLHCGRQSARNPGCADHPRLRRVENAFVWGYVMPPGHKKSGWLSLEVLEQDLGFEGLACGPAGADFDRRHPQRCGAHCDGKPIADVDRLRGTAAVSAREVYLRWSPRGTAFRYLVRADRVRRLARFRSGPHDYTAVEVLDGRWTPAGTRGWVLSSGLRTGRD
jgi:hypothetical protein